MKNRILIVEDDEWIGAMMVDVLSNLDYEVTFIDGLSSAKKLTRYDYAAVISDFRLLDGDACDVIEFLRSKKPDIAAIVTSGDGKQAATDFEDRRISGVVFVSKPFRPHQLLDALNTCLLTKSRGS